MPNLEQQIKAYIAMMIETGITKDNPDIRTLQLAGDIVHCYYLS